MKKNNTNELKLSRVYDAPVKAVWDAWTDPEQTGKWWGPRGFTLTTHSKDLRVGGHWKYTMHGPDGTNYENNTTYFEVEKYSKLVYDHGANDTQPPMFRVTVTFREVNGKTKMEMSMTFPSVEIRKQSEKFIKQAGGNSTWDRLAEYLAKQEDGKEKFIINRSFDASINEMYKMWSDPEHFSKWLAPTGFNMNFIRADIRPGGTSFYSMSNESIGMKMYGSIYYLEMQSANFIKYIQDFRDEKENISRHPGAPLWPEKMLTTVQFTEEAPDQTRVTVSWEAHGNFTTEELAAFAKEKAGMTIGWTGSFDKLEEYIAR